MFGNAESVAASVKELSSLGDKMFDLLRSDRAQRNAAPPAAPQADEPAPAHPGVLRFREVHPRPGAPA